MARRKSPPRSSPFLTEAKQHLHRDEIAEGRLHLQDVEQRRDDRAVLLSTAAQKTDCLDIVGPRPTTSRFQTDALPNNGRTTLNFDYNVWWVGHRIELDERFNA